MRGLQVVEFASSIPNLLMGETLPVATDMDTYTIRQPMSIYLSCSRCLSFYLLDGEILHWRCGWWNLSIQFPSYDSSLDIPIGHCVWKHMCHQAIRA